MSSLSTSPLAAPSFRSAAHVDSDFKLQSPPHRRKENRKCSINTSRQECDGSKITIPLLMSRRHRTLIKQSNDDSSLIDKESDNESDSSPRLCVETGDPLVSDVIYEETRPICTLTSPVKSPDSRFAWSSHATSKDTCSIVKREDRPLSSTSAYFNLARSSFGVDFRRRGSQQTFVSPTSSLQQRDHTIICLSPLTPLGGQTTLEVQNSLPVPIDGFPLALAVPLEDSAPLSATLKRIGAARERSFDDDVGKPRYRIATTTESSPSPEQLAEKIHVYQQAIEAGEENRRRLERVQNLFAEQSRLASIRECTKSSSTERDLSSADSPGLVQLRIQSTVRGGQRKSLLQSAFHRLSSILAEYTTRNRSRSREKDHISASDFEPVEIPELPTQVKSAVPKTRGDGWGGLILRESWFPNRKLGPLASPTSSMSSAKHLRPLRLSTLACQKQEDIWEDEEDETVAHLPSTDANVDQDPLHRLRVRFPSFLPRPSRMEEPKELEQEATVVMYTSTSAEGGPRDGSIAGRHLHRVRRHAGVLFSLFLLSGMATVVIVIIVSAKQHRPSEAVPES